MLRLSVLCFIVLASAPVFANNSDSLNSSNFSQASHSSRGGIGLINTPTARFSDDGEFGLGLSVEAPYNRMFAKMQFFQACVRKEFYILGLYQGQAGGRIWRRYLSQNGTGKNPDPNLLLNALDAVESAQKEVAAFNSQKD